MLSLQQNRSKLHQRFTRLCLPRNGTVSELSGRSSDKENIKTENARNTVVPSETFSPDSGGSQNMSSAMRDSTNEGITMYIM